jgi:hypothetical protein
VSVQIRLVARLCAALWLVVLVGAVAGRVVGGAVATQEAAPRGGRLAAAVLLANARLIAVLLVAAVLVTRVPQWRPIVDAVIGALLGVNALAVGGAIGAGGSEVVGSLAHLPLEWAALAVGLRSGLRWAAGSLVLVVLAAGVEAWVPVLG